MKDAVQVGNGEPPAFADWHRRRARKRWHCYECLDPILPGDVYHELRGLWCEGGFQNFRYCATCKRWADGAFFVLKLELYPLGELAESIAELTDQGGGVYFVPSRPRL